MVSLRCGRVYFAFEREMLVNAINRSKAWPSFKNKVCELRRLLEELLEWSVMIETWEVNRDVHLIASSVVDDDRFQSYVARGCYPSWLISNFCECLKTCCCFRFVVGLVIWLVSGCKTLFDE